MGNYLRIAARAFLAGEIFLLIASLGAPVAHAEERKKPEIVPPVRVDSEPMPYPEGATGEAVVILELEIEKDGSVGSVVVRDGAPPFDEAARVAAATWQFSPATRDGLPIRARILVKAAFHEPATKPATPPVPVPDDSPGPQESPNETAEPHSPAAPTAPPEPSRLQPPEPITVAVIGEAREEPGSTHIPRNEARLVPGAFADPFRVVEVLPGIAPILSGVPYFTVRGAPPGDVGYFIDGIRVPLLFHVGAGPSIMPPGLVDRVDLFPSVYPARFGRSSGGIMAGETMRPKAEAHGEVQARVFDASGMAEQPFADGRGSILIGGRYGYTGALLSVVAPDYALSYWDYQARISYRFAEHDRLSVFSFGAYDFLRNNAIARTLFKVQFHRLDTRWDHETERLRTRLAVTLSSDSTLNSQENTIDPGSSTTSRGARVRFELEDRVTHDFRVRAGADAGLEHFPNDSIARATTPGMFQANTLIPFGSHDDRYGGAWIDVVARPARGVEIVPAFRFDLFDVRNTKVLAPEPRVATRLRVANGVAWISAFGVTHQVPTFTVPVPGTEPSIFESSNQEVWQASQAVEVALPWQMLAKATVFRNVGFLTGAEGTAHEYGAELFLHRDFTERLGGFVSYTISRADRITPGVSTLSLFDRTHVLSAVLGYDLGAGYRFGARFFFESGHPYTLNCPTPGCVGAASPPPDSQYQFTGRFPNFSRLDIRLEKKWSFRGGATIAATFEWFNTFVKQEVDQVVWTPQGLSFSARSAITLPSIGAELNY